MTWEEAGLISKYPEVQKQLHAAASRNMRVQDLQELKKQLEVSYVAPTLSNLQGTIE
jgi:argininosuccinate lyase